MSQSSCYTVSRSLQALSSQESHCWFAAGFLLVLLGEPMASRRGGECRNNVDDVAREEKRREVTHRPSTELPRLAAVKCCRNLPLLLTPGYSRYSRPGVLPFSNFAGTLLCSQVCMCQRLSRTLQRDSSLAHAACGHWQLSF